MTRRTPSLPDHVRTESDDAGEIVGPGGFLASEMPGVTSAEQRRGETLDERIAQEEPDVGPEERAAPGHGAEESRPSPWNVVVTTRGGDYRYARDRLRRFGTVERAPFYNVLLLSVDDAAAFPDAIATAMAADPRLAEAIGHVAPATASFVFDTTEEFETRATAALLDVVDDLANASFYVRVHRRGGPPDLYSDAEEDLLATVLLDALDEAGTPGSITFEDPDVVVDVETVDHWAGVAVRTREDLHDFAFLEVR